MPWLTRPLPDALKLPACPRCENRGRVTQVARGIFVCTDCDPPHPFVAVWRPEPAALPDAGERERSA